MPRTANGNRLGLDFSTCTFAFPELDWVQQFLYYIEIKEIVSSPEKAHALRNVLPLLSPHFLRVLSFTTALSQEAATRFSAPLAGQRQVPRASPFPVAHSGTQAAFRQHTPGLPGARSRAPARRVAPLQAAGEQLWPAACPPPLKRPRVSAGPATLTLCRNSRATRRSMVRGVRALRGCGRCAERLRRRGRAPGRWEARPSLSPAAAYSIPGPRPPPPALPCLAALAVRAAGQP